MNQYSKMIVQLTDKIGKSKILNSDGEPKNCMSQILPSNWPMAKIERGQ